MTVQTFKHKQIPEVSARRKFKTHRKAQMQITRSEIHKPTGVLVIKETENSFELYVSTNTFNSWVYLQIFD